MFNTVIIPEGKKKKDEMENLVYHDIWGKKTNHQTLKDYKNTDLQKAYHTFH